MKTRSLATVAIVLLILAAGVGLLYVTRAQVTPTASAPTATVASPTPTAIATPTATASASPTPQGVYMSKKLGFALELPPLWHQALCGNSDPVGTRLPATEQFTSAGPMEEFMGDVGSPNDRVEVTVQANPQGLSPTAFAAGPNVMVLGTPRSVTFAGRPAAEVQASGPSGEQLAYYVADGDRMYAVLYRTDRSASEPRPDLATMQRIVRSFRFLAAAERQALPEPTPIPAAAATAPALAGMLASAFQQKDFAALERLLSPCVSYGVQQGGGSLITRQLFIAGLRTQFANGLTVTVDTNATRTATYDGETVTYVRSRWNAMPPGNLRPPPSPGQTAQNVDLRLYPTRGGLYWDGNLLVGG